MQAFKSFDEVDVNIFNLCKPNLGKFHTGQTRHFLTTSFSEDVIF